MRTIKIGKHEVEIYDAIEDLPIVRFHKYNKMLLIDAGCGSDLNDFARHVEKAIRFIGADQGKNAITELQNLIQNVYFIQSNVSPKCLAFAVLVKRLDGVECDDLSDAGLQRIVDLLNDVSTKDLTAQLDAVKKKIDDELRLYFPAIFDDVLVKEYHDILRERTLRVLETIISGKITEDDALELDKLTGQLLTYFKPQKFDGEESTEIKYDLQFEDMCLLISQNLNVDAKKYSVLAYYNAYKKILDMAKEAKKQKKPK